MKSPSLVLAALAALQLSACADLPDKPDEMSWEEFDALQESGDEVDDQSSALSTTPAAREGSGTSNTGTLTWTDRGSLVAAEWRHAPAFAVKPGSKFSAVMTGTGDIDLYVRFGAQPTPSAWHCRPYSEGSNETCTVTVPISASKAYVSVRAFRAGSYGLTVSYLEDLVAVPPDPTL